MRWLTLPLILVFVLSGCSEDRAEPRCEIVPAEIQFGLVRFAGPPDSFSVYQHVEVQSIGDRQLEFTVKLDTPTGEGVPRFSLAPGTPDPFVVPPGDSAIITLVLTGTSNSREGTYEGQLDLGLPCGSIPFSAQVEVAD